MLQRENLLTRLKQQYNTMSKGQKRLTDYIVSHYDKAAFMTAARLGKEVGVSESTAVRFAIQLGFEGFPEFHEALQELVMNKLNSIQRIEVTSGRIPQAKVLDTVLQSDIEKIKMTLEQTDRDAFRLAVQTILEADTIYVVGVRSCAPLASFLGYYLNQIFGSVRLVTTSGATEVYEQIIHISEKDVIIGISFPRYSMRTLKAMEYANARSDMVSIVDSLVAPLSIINALIVALCMKREKEVMNTLETMEKIWDEYEVFSGDDIDHLDDRLKLQIKNPGEKDE